MSTHALPGARRADRHPPAARHSVYVRVTDGDEWELQGTHLTPEAAWRSIDRLRADRGAAVEVLVLGSNRTLRPASRLRVEGRSAGRPLLPRPSFGSGRAGQVS